MNLSPYAPDDVKKIRAVLENIAPTADHAELLKRIEEKAFDYAILADVEEHTPEFLRERRRDFGKLESQASQLLNTIASLGSAAWVRLEALHSRVHHDLNTLRSYGAAVSHVHGRPGRPRKTARLAFVYVLGQIYYEAIGTLPTRMHDRVRGEDYGDFRKLVRAALGPLSPAEVNAADHDIREVVSHMASNPPEN